jgi:hypothetical protein
VLAGQMEIHIDSLVGRHPVGPGVPVDTSTF